VRRHLTRSRALAALGAVVALAAAGIVVSLVTAPGSTDPQAAETLTAPPVKPAFALAIGRPEGRPVPAGFLGFSIEFQAIRSYTGKDPQRINPVFIQLIRNLSSGQAPVIRIGGDSTDASWAPAPGIHPPPQVTYKLTPSWYATTAAAIHMLGAKLTIGVNLGADQPALAAAEARRDVRAFKGSLQAFEIGNEPNVYNKIPAYTTATGKPILTRASSFGYSQYLEQFEAIARRLPALPLAGPALAAGPTPMPGSWTELMTGFMHSNDRLRYLTIHRYPLRNCFVAPGSAQYPTVPNLLSTYATAGLAAGVRRYVEIARATGSQLRIDELNSVACHGKRGVSDTFASALWAVDALFELARIGVDGVNLHTLPHAAYQLFAFSHAGGRWSAAVAPVYYGLYLFSRAAPPGSRLLRVQGARHAPGLSVWATRAADGQVRAVIDNESQSRRVNIGLRAPADTRGPATLLRMQAPGVRARGRVTIGGASFGAHTDTGILPPPESVRLDQRGGLYSLSVPAGSAALVTFARR
jgi:hypothetical protein